MTRLLSQDIFKLIVVTLVVTHYQEYSVEGNTVQYLAKLGKSLEDRLSHPGKECNTLLRDLFDYNNHLEEIRKIITGRNQEYIKQGYDIVEHLVKDGGPPHLNIEVDFDEFLFKVFKNDKDVNVIDKVLKYNRKEWNKIKSLYEQHKQL